MIRVVAEIAVCIVIVAIEIAVVVAIFAPHALARWLRAALDAVFGRPWRRLRRLGSLSRPQQTGTATRHE